MTRSDSCQSTAAAPRRTRFYLYTGENARVYKSSKRPLRLRHGVAPLHTSTTHMSLPLSNANTSTATAVIPALDERPRAVAVYCGANPGTVPAFQHAATSLGRALASNSRPLVYGGGSRGMMGIISGSVLKHGGDVTAVVPAAMLRAGGEGERTCGSMSPVQLNEKGREKVESIIVDSMHERKVEMARRARGFIGLPGGFGTFEEIMEVTTWTQLGIHKKPVVLVNVLGFFDPLRVLIKNSIATGFIRERNENLITFVDCPPGIDPTSFDWGEAALSAMDGWRVPGPGLFAWRVAP